MPEVWPEGRLGSSMGLKGMGSLLSGGRRRSTQGFQIVSSKNSWQMYRGGRVDVYRDKILTILDREEAQYGTEGLGEVVVK